MLDVAQFPPGTAVTTPLGKGTVIANIGGVVLVHLPGISKVYPEVHATEDEVFFHGDAWPIV